MYTAKIGQLTEDAGEMIRMFAGVDIGATSVKVGIVTSEGAVVAREQEKYCADKVKPQDVVDLAIFVLHRVLNETHLNLEDLRAVGVGCPGVLEAGGIVHAAANFPSWKAVPLQQLFTDTLGIPVTMCNDADAAILAEQWVGTAKGGVKDFIMLTLGTGIGFGAVVNGKLVRGGNNATEGGHIIVERNGRLCGCSQRGCLEAYSSANALLSQLHEHLRAGKISSLSKDREVPIDVKVLFKHAYEGDELCQHLVETVRARAHTFALDGDFILSEQAADYLGFACVIFCRVLDPEIIVLSGGIAEAGETYIEKIRLAYAKYSWIRFPNPVRIEKASAGYDSGIIGAVAVHACKSEEDTRMTRC